MKTKSFKLVVPAFVSLSLAVGTVTVTLPFTADMAFAKNENANSGNKGGNGNGNKGGNGNGNGNGNSGNSNKGGNGNGAVASELKGLNAAHANANAFENASPNSQVGLIATYSIEALDAIAAGEALTGAQQALADLLAAYTGRTSAEVQADIDSYSDPASPNYIDPALYATDADYQAALDAATAALQTELDAANAQETAVADAEQDIIDAEAALAQAELDEEAALLAACNCEGLSDEALAAFREMLVL